MNSLDATEIILSQLGKPLHYKEITQRILQQNLWPSEGKTPEASVNASLAVDIKEKGTASRLQRTGSGTYALRAWGLTEFTTKSKASRVKTPEITTEEPPKTSTKLSFNDAAKQNIGSSL